jgi:predicted phage terminase large subunit-like protein
VTFQPKSFRFIPLTIYDNPVILKNNPAYLASLLSQKRVSQLRYLYGSWTARAEGSGFYRREWTPIVEPHEVPRTGIARVRSWDMAASVVSETNRDPDWTAGVKLFRDKFGYYYVEHVNRFRKLSDGVLQELIKTGHADGLPPTCGVTIPKDPGAGGAAACRFFLSKLAENGIAAKAIPISGHTGKIARFLPFAAMCEAGMVRVVRGDWNEDFFTELEYFEGNRDQKDDQVDAVADAFNTLSKQVMLPTIAMPKMQMDSPVPTM